MEIERIKKLTESKVKAGNITKRVRTVLKDYEHSKQDVQEELSKHLNQLSKLKRRLKRQLMKTKIKCLNSYRKIKKQ